MKSSKKSPVWRLFFRLNALSFPQKEEKMFNYLGHSHNEVDGAFCYGGLVFVGLEPGTRGFICIYRCSCCGAILRVAEN